MNCQFCGSSACEWAGTTQIGCTDCGYELAPGTGAMAALVRARSAWGMTSMQMELSCVVCNDQGCEHCPRI